MSTHARRRMPGNHIRRFRHFVENTPKFFKSRRGDHDAVIPPPNILGNAQETATRIFFERKGKGLSFNLKFFQLYCRLGNWRFRTAMTVRTPPEGRWPFVRDHKWRLFKPVTTSRHCRTIYSSWQYQKIPDDYFGRCWLRHRNSYLGTLWARNQNHLLLYQDGILPSGSRGGRTAFLNPFSQWTRTHWCFFM
jgi:hypothetical protein